MAAPTIAGVPKLGGGGGLTSPIAISDTTGLQSALDAKAPTANPTFTGTVTLPSGIVLPSSAVATTQAADDNSTKLATTAYADAIKALKANLASPTFTGTPAAPTPTADDNSTKLATTAYADAIKALKANIASPTFTGVPTSPAYSASGLTGATSASRYVGATTSGAPTSGTFSTGDWVVDQSGAEYLCTSGGTPGTWTLISPVVQNSGLLGETGASAEALIAQATPVLPTGRIFDCRLTVRTSAASATRTIFYYLNTIGLSVTSGLFAVYNSAGTKLGSTSADQSASLNGTAGLLSATVGTFALNAGDVIHIELLTVGAGTQPKMGGLTALQTVATNANLSGASLRSSVQTSSGASSMPASITPSSLSATNALQMWFGIA